MAAVGPAEDPFLDLINVGPLPGNPDPVGFIRRLGDEVVPKAVEIG
jgi:hypothetical protein